MDEIRSVESLQLGFGTIKVATDDFSDANKLGQGGFGVVYKVNLTLSIINSLKKDNLMGRTCLMIEVGY